MSGVRSLGLLVLIAASGAAFAAPSARFTGTPRADVIRGTPAGDTMHGLRGSDRLIGVGGNDSLVGGPGDDVLLGGRSGDLLVGGPGDDRIDGRDPERRRCSARLLASTRPLRSSDYPPCVDIVGAGPGDDVILLRDGRFDAVWFCGRGTDTVIADRIDELADCEVKRR